MGRQRESWSAVCLRCREEAKARRFEPGSSGIEILLYVATIPLLCLGGLLYSGYRSVHSYWGCDVCSSKEIVPVGTRRARELLASEEGPPS